jgi:hypothetical protein
MTVGGDRIEAKIDLLVQAEGRLTNTIRSSATPLSAKYLIVRSRQTPVGASSISRERSTACNTSAQSASTPAFTLQKLFRHPNVINPFSSAGKELTGISLTIG